MKPATFTRRRSPPAVQCAAPISPNPERDALLALMKKATQCAQWVDEAETAFDGADRGRQLARIVKKLDAALLAQPDLSGEVERLQSQVRTLVAAVGEHVTVRSDLRAEVTRLSGEVAALRASLGEPTGAEPVGCPCPGACSATALQERVAGLESDGAKWRDAATSYRARLAKQEAGMGAMREALEAAAEEHFAASNARRGPAWERKAHAHAWAGMVQAIRIVDQALSDHTVRDLEVVPARAVTPGIEPEQWRDISTAPEDGSYINVRSVTTYRYLLYKPDGRRQMGTRGRWQSATEHGWANAALPALADWKPNAPIEPEQSSERGEGA